MKNRDRGEYVVEQQRKLLWSQTPFDRVAYAWRVLRALRPPELTVAIREGFRELTVQQGRMWDRRSGTWAIVAIPPDATREEIALALVRLAGLEDSPFALELALSLHDGAPYRSSRG